MISKTIYILCPENVETGGTELLHQLAFRLNSIDKKAYIVYTDIDGNISDKASIPKGFLLYNVDVAYNIEDRESTIVVFHEGILNKAFKFKYATKIFWWLSIDNFYVNSVKYISILDYFKWNKFMMIKVILIRLYNLIFKKKNYFTNNHSISDLINLDVLNCYQSEYAQYYLNKLGFRRTLPLTDFLNISFFKDVNNKTKKNRILYNPKKGLNYTKKLQKLAPDLEWIPLINKTREELLDLFQTSKIYIDFGHFPGKDRMPREAVINGCCIITGIKGASRFYEDVTIPSKYKIKQTNRNLKTIISRIREVFENYEICKNDFDIYYNLIKNEQILFENQVDNIFISQNKVL